jgi:hypothetical protein
MTKLTKQETRLIDQEILIHNLTLNRAIFYSVLGRVMSHWRAEELHDNDAYEQYLESLINDYLNI